MTSGWDILYRSAQLTGMSGSEQAVRRSETCYASMQAAVQHEEHGRERSEWGTKTFVILWVKPHDLMHNQGSHIKGTQGSGIQVEK